MSIYPSKHPGGAPVRPVPANVSRILTPTGYKSAFPRTRNAYTLFRHYCSVYDAENMPEWCVMKLWALSEAEANRRRAQADLSKTVIGSPERSAVLREIKMYQDVVDRNDKFIRDAARDKGPQTAADKRDAAALDALENTDFGRKLKQIHGETDATE